MKVILDKIKYVTKDGEERYFEEIEFEIPDDVCEIPDDITDDEKISEEITKRVKEYLEKGGSELKS